jgi:molybdopterin molybdotransferase
MSKPFLRVLSLDEARELLKKFGSLESEKIPVEESVFRVLGEPVKAREDMPGFHRSTMDGFAVRSVDTFGASESSPALFSIIGEVAMGRVRDIKLERGQAARIWTGGALPDGSDAVVMVEQTQELDEQTVEVLKAVAPYENVVRRGEDYKAGETLLGVGQRLRPQDLGLLAAMGRTTVTVHRKPLVAIISSGDEIVPIDQEPPPGCVRDVNRYTLSAMARRLLRNRSG